MVHGSMIEAMVAWLALDSGAWHRASKQERRGAAISNWSSTPDRASSGFESRGDLAPALGRTDIEGDDVYVLLSEAETHPPEQVQFEAHRRYIDIQFVVRGQESIGVAPLAGLVTIEPYDAARDIEFFAAPQQSETLALRAGDFAVFTPGDAHRPSLHLDGPHVSRKAVVKVSVAYRERQRAAAAR